MFAVRKDADARWRKYPDITVHIEGGCDPHSEAQDWNFKVSKANGQFIVGTGYNKIESCRKAAERAIKRGVWQTPRPVVTKAKRAEIFGAIPEASGDLADFLNNWTAEYA